MEIYRGPDQERFEQLDVTVHGCAYTLSISDLELCSEMNLPAWALLSLFDDAEIRRHSLGIYHAPDGRSLSVARTADFFLVLALGEVQPGLYAASLEGVFPCIHRGAIERSHYMIVSDPTDRQRLAVDFVVAPLDYEHCGFDLLSDTGLASPVRSDTISDLDSHHQVAEESLTSTPARRLVPRYLTISEPSPAVQLQGTQTFLLRDDMAASLRANNTSSFATVVFEPPAFEPPVFVHQRPATRADAPPPRLR